MSENQGGGREQVRDRYFFRAVAEDFKKISGKPIAYWATPGLIRAFENGVTLANISIPRQGLATMDNSRFTRAWYEVSLSKASFRAGQAKGVKWYPYNKGGGFRKWYGNQEILVNWGDNGKEIKSLAIERYGSASKRVVNEDSYFLPSITWSKISSSRPSFRYQPQGAIFDVAGMSIFPTKEREFWELLTLLNSKLVLQVLELLSPTLNFEAGQIGSIPVICPKINVELIYKALLSIGKIDWNSYEASWDFSSLPLLHPDHRQPTLKATYQSLRAQWLEMTLQMQHLEQENNRIFIDAYGLQDELDEKVDLSEITLTCNPQYRYGSDKPVEELEAMLLADTMQEQVSYAVGCMLGRYSMDMPGLILANQGELLADYLEQHRLAQVPQPRFPADDDNVIPVLDGDWFADDITLRFRQFLRVAFGDEHYEDNLAFIEQALNLKGKRNYSLRDYFLGEFYTDHVKRYKKRPIYWLFSSPRGSFNALIYMHRYRPDTVSVVLRYLRDFRKKVADEKDRQASASINPAVSQGDRTRALKETDRLNKVLAELDDYERDVIYPLATQQIEIDLDDGVKVNYLKFGAALKKIVGLEAKDED